MKNRDTVLTVSKEQASHDVNEVKQKITDPDTKIQTLHSKVMIKLNAHNSSFDGNQTKPLTSLVASANDVKQSVCFVVHGFPENGNDYNELLVMFNFLEYKCDIKSPSRIGQLN